MQMKANIIFRIIPVVVASLWAFTASGQNLDPTVEVSRAYEGKLMVVHKPQLKMAVPDSVLRFDLDFDYSVSDSPYKGAYEFSPYTLDMKPSPTVRDMNSFYLKAGAGYQLHPVFDAVWSPFFNGPFRMNAYASHRSFIGNYWTMDSPVDDGDAVVFDRMKKADGSTRSWPGYDLRSKAGFEGRYDWSNMLLGFDIGYFGLHQQDRLFHVTGRAYDAATARIAVASKNHPDVPLGYHADLFYRFAEDKMSDTASADSYLKENDFSVDGGVSYSFFNGDRLGLKMGFRMAMTDGCVYTRGGDVDVVPHYVMSRDRWNFDLGVRISSSFKSDVFSEMYSYEEQMIYPDVRVEFRAIPDALKLYLNIGGDSRVNSYADIIERDQRADIRYGRQLQDVLDITDEKIAVSAGAEGRLGKRFSYGLEGGYVRYGNAPLDGAVYGYGANARWLPILGYSSYDRIFVSLDWLLDADHFRFDGKVDYSYYSDLSLSSGEGLMLPASLTGDVAFRYDWKDRVLFGVDCVFSTARKGTALYGDRVIDASVPGYADLGVELEYVVNRKFSAWARGGNLLGMTVQKSFLYAEKGPYFTLGICLNL